MLGHICLACRRSRPSISGLALIALGTGLLKPNVSALVGKLYRRTTCGATRGSRSTTWASTPGAFIAPLICGWLAQSEQFRAFSPRLGIAPETSWHWGFAMAAVGMFFGLVQYLAGWKHLGDGRHVSRAGGVAGAGGVTTAPAATGTRRGPGRGAVLAGAVRRQHRANHRPGREQCPRSRSPDHDDRCSSPGCSLAAKWTTEERKRLVVVLVLFVAAMIFWSVFEQAGSTLISSPSGPPGPRCSGSPSRRAGCSRSRPSSLVDTVPSVFAESASGFWSGGGTRRSGTRAPCRAT